MKKSLFLLLCVCCFLFTRAQQTGYPADVATALETIKTNVFKTGWQHLVSFDEVNNAAVNVNRHTEYMIFYVYDNSNHPAPKFKAYLMTANQEMKKKYTAKPDDIGQLGTARIQQLKFKTRNFDSEEGATRPVKIEADPKATVYVFYRN